MTEFFFENCNFSSDVKLDLIAKGKVRDIYDIRDKHKILLVASDRASAFDYNICELNGKGTVLTELAGYWFKKLGNIAENHYIDHYKNYMLVQKCNPIKLEFIVRGYITGSCWKKYSNGERLFCGVILEEGLVKNQQFSKPIITPTTKGEHDYPISQEEILNEHILSEQQLAYISKKCMELYLAGSAEYEKKGLILVDTKYEFGFDEVSGCILLIDEIHTPDCSRVWNKESYDAYVENGYSGDIINSDKDILRNYLNSISFSEKINTHINNGNDLETFEMPLIPNEVINHFNDTYNTINHLFNGVINYSEKETHIVNYNCNSLIGNNNLQSIVVGNNIVNHTLHMSLFYHHLINRENKFVMIISGSKSDEKHINLLLKYLLNHNIKGGCCFVSAHKNTQKAVDYINYINQNYNKVIWITVAGMSNALSGVVSANTQFPVIACPPFKDQTDMMVNINSTLQMPSKVPVMTVICPSNATLCCKRIFDMM
jgi:fusion protein PurCD